MADFWWRHLVPAKLLLEADPSATDTIERMYTPRQVPHTPTCSCAALSLRAVVRRCSCGGCKQLRRAAWLQVACSAYMQHLHSWRCHGQLLGTASYIHGSLAPLACCCCRVACGCLSVCRVHPYRAEIIRRSKALVEAAPQRTFTAEETAGHVQPAAAAGAVVAAGGCAAAAAAGGV